MWVVPSQGALGQESSFAISSRQVPGKAMYEEGAPGKALCRALSGVFLALGWLTSVNSTFLRSVS